MTTSFTASGKPKRTVESMRVERQYANVINLFLSGQMPNFTHQRHVHVANILRHIPYGRELMHLGLQVMAHRAYIPHKYSADITDRNWDMLDGTCPVPKRLPTCPEGHPAGKPDDATRQAMELLRLENRHGSRHYRDRSPGASSTTPFRSSSSRCRKNGLVDGAPDRRLFAGVAAPLASPRPSLVAVRSPWPRALMTAGSISAPSWSFAWSRVDRSPPTTWSGQGSVSRWPRRSTTPPLPRSPGGSSAIAVGASPRHRRRWFRQHDRPPVVRLAGRSLRRGANALLCWPASWPCAIPPPRPLLRRRPEDGSSAQTARSRATGDGARLNPAANPTASPSARPYATPPSAG